MLLLLLTLIHLITYNDFEPTFGHPAYIGDLSGVVILLTPEGTLMNIMTKPDVIVLSYNPHEDVPDRFGYTSHLFESSPRISVILALPFTRFVITLGSYTSLF